MKYGDPVLEKPGATIKKFDAELEPLAEDMFASMYAAQGVGLAAPQIGKSIRLAVVDVTTGKNPEAKIVLVNPEIIHAEGEVREEEGCLSIPGFRGYVMRPQFVTVRAQNVKGETFEIRGENLLARAFCHEIDHLNGDSVSAASEHAEARPDQAKNQEAAERRRVVNSAACAGERLVSRLRMVFCGTPQFAVPSLKHLLQQDDFEIVGVFTQPDRPRGRGQEISFSPVKEVALAAKMPVHQPAKVRAPEVEEQLRALAPDAIVIIAYGQIIPARLLGIPKFGWINLHASLLPKYRGAAPINWAIVNGETRTGNTTMRIDAGMDTGEMLLQEELEIGADETAPELARRLAEAGAPLMVETLRGLVAGTVTPRAQNHAEVTLAPI